MKKTVSILLLVLGIVSSLASQTTGSRTDSGLLDLVVLLDTSVSMSDSYEETTAYLTGPFLREFLRIGDTFHLISFSREPRLEIIRRVEGVGDLETIIGRILLLYPLAREADPVKALDYAENYAASLSTARSQKIILITGSDDPQTENAVTALSSRINRGRTEVHYIKVPVTAPVQSVSTQNAGTPPVSGEESPAPLSELSTGRQTFSGTQNSEPSTPDQITEQAAAPGEAVFDAPITSSPLETLSPVETLSPSGAGPSTAALSPEETAASGGAAPSPAQEQSAVLPQLTQSGGSSGTGTNSSEGAVSLPLIIALIILGLLVLGLILFFAFRQLRSSPNRAMTAASSPAAPLPGSRFLPKDKEVDQNLDFENGPPLLSLFVEDQTTAIGRRNIHAVKKGYTFTIGGGNSDFLIFLVHMPPKLANFAFDGKQCTFIPRKPEYFPDLGSQQLPNCIGKTIRVISDKNYELHIRIERYEDPLIALNKLLNSIRMPGL